MSVFWAKGYDGASLTDLTSAMGINSPSLYAAFCSKEALFREAVELYKRTQGTEIWTSLDDAPTARQAIEHFLRKTAISYTTPGMPPGCLIVLGALPESGTNAAACAELREERADNVEQLRRRLERAQAEGELPAGADCRAIAAFYATLQQGMSIQARDGADRDRLMAIAEAGIAAWDGLAGSPSD